MGAKWSDLSSTSSADRLSPAPAVHLSDGTLVFVDVDSEPHLKYSANRSGTPTVIADLSTMTGPCAVAVDNNDNIFVVGAGTSDFLIAQAFTKGAGHSWTAQATSSQGWQSVINSACLSWANTGGGLNGAGHLFGVVTFNANEPVCWFVFDAGKLLAGSAAAVGGSTVTAFPQPEHTYAADVASDGLGATTGLLAALNGATGYYGGVVTWQVSSAGSVTLTNLSSAVSWSGPGSAMPRIRVVRYGPGSFAVVSPDTATSGAYQARAFGLSGSLGAGAATGNPANLPLNSGGLAWDAFADPQVPGRIWVIATGPETAGTDPVYRTACLFSAGVASWTGTVVTDDTLSTYAAPGLTLNAVKQPVANTVDWMTTEETVSGTYALQGDYSQLSGSGLSMLV